MHPSEQTGCQGREVALGPFTKAFHYSKFWAPVSVSINVVHSDRKWKRAESSHCPLLCQHCGWEHRWSCWALNASLIPGVPPGYKPCLSTSGVLTRDAIPIFQVRELKCRELYTLPKRWNQHSYVSLPNTRSSFVVILRRYSQSFLNALHWRASSDLLRVVFNSLIWNLWAKWEWHCLFPFCNIFFLSMPSLGLSRIYHSLQLICMVN